MGHYIVCLITLEGSDPSLPVFKIGVHPMPPRILSKLKHLCGINIFFFKKCLGFGVFLGGIGGTSEVYILELFRRLLETYTTKNT